MFLLRHVFIYMFLIVSYAVSSGSNESDTRISETRASASLIQLAPPFNDIFYKRYRNGCGVLTNENGEIRTFDEGSPILFCGKIKYFGNRILIRDKPEYSERFEEFLIEKNNQDLRVEAVFFDSGYGDIYKKDNDGLMLVKYHENPDKRLEMRAYPKGDVILGYKVEFDDYGDVSKVNIYGNVEITDELGARIIDTILVDNLGEEQLMLEVVAGKEHVFIKKNDLIIK